MTIPRFALVTLALAAPLPCVAQAVDPVTTGQILTQRGTNEGYVDRARARARGSIPVPAVSQDCMRAWKLHSRMTRQEKRRLYELCPR